MNPREPVAAYVGAQVIRVLGTTWKIRYHGEEQLEKARRSFPYVIYAFWHGRMLPLCYTHRNRLIQVLASEHRDGELMGRVISYLGFGHLRGSSSRGGARGLRQMVKKIRDGFDLGITVDGPKGPRFRVKPGSVEVAKLTGAPVVPITTSSKSHWLFSSWDGMEVPKPFTEVVVRYGGAVFVPCDAPREVLEEKRKILEEELRAITRDSDEEVS